MPTTNKPSANAAPSANKPADNAAKPDNAAKQSKRGRKPAKPADPDYTARHDASRERVSKLYAGLSQSTTRYRSPRPFAVYAESARSGNGHAPNSETERDITALLEAAKLAGFKAGVAYNPGTIGGDKSAHGIRMHGHGFATFNKAGDAFVLTDAGVARAIKARADADKRGVKY